MKNSLLIVGALVGCLGGATLGACSSSSATGTTGTTTHATTTTGTTTTGSGGSGGGTTTTTTTGGSTTTTTTTTTAGTGGGDAGTCKSPASLHPASPDAGALTIYCPFSGIDGGDLYCDNQNATAPQHCCVPTTGNSDCSATACTFGTAGMDWECQEPGDCKTGMDCCATGSIAQNSVNGQLCPGDWFASGMHAATCVAAGSCTTVKLCASNTDCPTAHPTCTAFRKQGAIVGGCY